MNARRRGTSSGPENVWSILGSLKIAVRAFGTLEETGVAPDARFALGASIPNR
jgi:hypothetical protein